MQNFPRFLVSITKQGIQHESLARGCTRQTKTSTRACSDSLRGNDFKLKGKFRLDTSKIFFTVRAVTLWNSFSREVMDAPSPEALL